MVSFHSPISDTLMESREEASYINNNVRRSLANLEFRLHNVINNLM